MREVFHILLPLSLAAVFLTLCVGIYALFRGGDFGRSWSNKLMRLQVEIGGERRQIVAGIAAQYAPEQLVGRNVVVVANLKPAKLMGIESNGMVLAASVGEAGAPVLLDVPADVPPGSKVK